MSLLEDAADYEEQHWRGRLSYWRRQAARDYLGQLIRVVVALVLIALLLDGARRDLLQGSATVVAFTPGATLQTASGKSAPAQSFIGQSFNPGDTLATNETGTLTLAYPDGTVVRIGPKSQLRLVQIDSFRNGKKLRRFQIVGSFQLHNPTHTTLTLFGNNGSSWHTSAQSLRQGPPIEGLSLERYSQKPSFLTNLERTIWWPLDTVLQRLGVSTRGAFLNTDSKQRTACRRLCQDLQKALSGTATTSLPLGKPLLLESVLPVPRTAKCPVAGPLFVLEQAGTDFIARVRARDSAGTIFRITPKSVEIEPVK